MSETTNGTYTSAASIGTSDADIVKRWTMELDLSDKAEKDWRADAEAIIAKYRPKKSKKNNFNVLWSNTETLRQAIYNTLPKPDVRRRYRDADPVGKVVSDVLERCVEYSMDVYDFDHVLKLDLMDMLLPGRGVSRVKYIPDLEDMESDASQETTTSEGEPAETEEPAEKCDEMCEPEQRIVYESVVCEHVQYDDFRMGPGKTWDENPWIAFRHRFSESSGVQKFGDVFKDVPLDDCADESLEKNSPSIARLFKTGEVWEIWNKDDRQVLWIAKQYKTGPLHALDNPDDEDPLKLDGFWPVPRPLYAIEDATSMLPTPLYQQYEQQAMELDRVSSRINVLTDALKVRGVYNSVMTEISKLQDAGDNTLIAAQNVVALQESGGIEAHIWYMPIEQAANVIQVLIGQREACKAVIYEITGIADIMRGATDAQETLGAQKIKSQWGTQRLKKMQAEFQRYVRDIIRLKAQIIANKFQPETIKQMTGLKLADTDQEKEAIKAQMQAFQQYQQSQQQAQQQPQGAPPQSGMMPQGAMA